MLMNEQPQPVADDHPTVPRRVRTSRLAVVALVLAAIPCCPMVSLAGALLGLAALRRIHAAGNALAGTRVAQWAVGVGFALTILSTALLTMLAHQFDDANRRVMTAQIAEVINASTVGQVDRSAKSWNNIGSSTPAAAEFERFGHLVLNRYGRLQRFSISSTTVGGSLFQQHIEVAGVYIFQNAERPGSAVFEVHAGGVDLWPQFRLRSLVIEDREKGDLKLPVDRP